VFCLAFVIGLAAALTLWPLGQAARMVMPPLEKPDLKFSIMTTTDLGPFWLAVQKGYFREEGFTFDPVTDVRHAESGAQSVAMLEDDTVDVAYATYPPFIAMQSRGKNVKLIAAASLAGPGSCMVVAMPNSKINSVADMAGARVAITAPNTVSQLMVQSALKASGVDYQTIQWVTVPFEGMEGKLAIGEIDAAFMVEPFLSQAQNNIGAVSVFDTAVGRTSNLATAGFGANSEFVSKYPRTAAAFQRVMQRATEVANEDRANVTPALVQFAHLDTSTAKLPSLLTFQSSLNAVELQRVADLMVDFGMIGTPIDVSRMIARIPTGR
jgi:NitT/TauT family transport system substrate-binding protein